MMKLFATAIFLLPISGYAQNTINCTGSTCSPSFPPSLILERPQYTSIDVGTNTADIQVTSNPLLAPRSLRINVRNGATARGLNVNLSAQNSATNAANTLILGDFFTNLNVNLNGYIGPKGKDASELCADRILAGSYGVAALNAFNQRRVLDPQLSSGRCDSIDINYLQNFNFTCEDPTFTQLPGTTPQVSVSRLISRASCTGILVRDVCVRHKIDVTCSWTQLREVCSKKDGCSKRVERTLDATVPERAEEQVARLRSELGDFDFCKNFVFNPDQADGGPWDLTGRLSAVVSAITTKRSLNNTFNPNTFEPEGPNSVFEMYKTEAYKSCAIDWARARTETDSVVAFDETGTNACNKQFINIPEDPDKLINWVFTGQVQEPSFGTESVQCLLGECPVSSSLLESPRTLETLQPQDGSSGTKQGRGIALVYDANNVSVSANSGQAGAAGKSDITAPTSTRFCVKVRDAATDGLNSNFAKTPQVFFHRYSWSALKTTGGGNNGTQPEVSGDKVNVYKKVDSSVIYMLSRELF